MTVVAWALGAVLVWSAAAKLASPRRSAAAMRTFGLGPAAVRRAAVVAVAGVELVLGAAVALGSDVAALAAAALVAALGVALGIALLAGRAGRPCGCFGPRSTVGIAAVVRNAALAAALAALPALEGLEVSRQRWTEALAVVALAGVAVLGALLAGLAREVAALRLRVGPQMPLAIEGEGPPVGTVDEALAGDGELAVAVFTSSGCALCAALAPAVAELGRDPRLAVRTFDEHAHADVWQRLAIPGSPYAVIASHVGTVLASGTFNSLGQLDSLVGWAREAEGAVAHA